VIIGIDNTHNSYGSKAQLFLLEIAKRLAVQNPKQRFYYFNDDKSLLPKFASENIIVLKIGSRLGVSALSNLWLRIKLLFLIKKNKIDLIISTQSIYHKKSAQCLLVADLDFIFFPALNINQHRQNLLTKLKKNINKAGLLVATTDEIKNEICKLFKISQQQIVIVPSAPRDVIQSRNDQQKQRVKEKNTGGKEYFFYKVKDENLYGITNLLKAFSIFKKRQQSDWQLVIASTTNIKESALQIQNYKYRNDVVLIIGDMNENTSDLSLSAYATIDFTYSGLSMDNLESMIAGVPVLTHAINKETSKGILHLKSHDAEDIAEGMMLIYKDEELRNNIIEKGKKIAASYSWEQSAKIFWEQISQHGNSKQLTSQKVYNGKL
jgi:glycosyltransferase involved in cell wall biosynthesis